MKKISLLLLLVVTIATANAQLSGVKNIPGDYADLAAAITALNAGGVGSGGVTLNVIASNPQTVAGAALQLTATGTSANRITIRGNGNTVNYTGTAGVLDGVFVLNGSDYVTVDNFVITADATTEWGVALLTPTPNNGCRNDSILNMNITLVKTNLASVGIYSAHHTNALATPLTVTAFSATNSYNKFLNNRIQNVYSGYSITGFPAAAPYDLYDQQNEIGKTTGNISSINNFGGGANQAQGVNAISQNKLKIYRTNINSAGGVNSTNVLYGINLGTGVNSDVDVYNDTIALTSAATTSNMFAVNTIMGGSGAGNTVNMYNNLVQNCNYTALSSGEFRGLFSSATATYTNMYNNNVTNNTLNTSGAISPIYYTGSSTTLVLKTDIYSNTITNNFRTPGVTAGAFHCIYASTSTFLTQTHDNVMNNNGNSTTSAGATYGYYNFGFGFNETIYNNQISNLTGGTGITLGVLAASGSGPTNKAVYNNQIYNFTGAGQTGAVTLDYATTGSVYKNNIYNLSSTSVLGSPVVFGINVGTNVNTNISVYNNFISELKAPLSTSNFAVYGLFLQGLAAISRIDAYNNSVYLNATSASATTFGTAAAFLSATPADIILRNNILVNMSVPGPTGGSSSAIIRIAVGVTNYDILSSYNCLYAGTPAVNRLIYTDGTNNDQTLAAFINRVNPREHASFTELPPFVNVAASPYDLHINPASATQCESGGTPIALVATDFDGNARYNNAGFPVGTFPPTASDVGADEFGGNAMNDIAAPRIDYTVLGNDIVTGTRTLTSFATITDPSGVNVTPSTKPRLYYKKSTNTNTFNDNTSGTDGWKYVEASNAASPFSFTIDYTLLQGGTTAVADIIQYFVIAQDLAGTPNVSMNAGGFTVNPGSVNLAAPNFPITGTINQYTIVANAYSGNINVGTAETITSLTNAGGLFALINAGVVTGDITARITSDLSAETGLNALNEFKETGAGNYKLSIVPDAATLRTISGAAATQALIRLDGADRTTIDGRFAGAGSFLRIRNTDNTKPGILLFNDAQYNTIRNTIIESGNTTVATQNLGGAIHIGNSAVVNGNGNDNNIITYNEVRDRSDVAGTPNIGIIALGATTGTLKLYNDNNIISNNNIHDFFGAASTTQAGIHIGVGNSRYNIDSNSIYQTAARVYTLSAATARGIFITQTSPVDNYGGYNVRYNYVGGTAPNGGLNGNYWTVSSTAAIVNNFQGINISTGLIPTVVSNNVIKNIDYTTVAPATAANTFIGLATAGGIFDVNNNQVGAPTGNDSIRITINLSSGTNNTSFISGLSISPGGGSSNTLTANKIGGITMAGSGTSSVFTQLMQLQGTPVLPVTATGNIIGSLATPNSIQTNYAANPQSLIFGIRTLMSNGAGINILNNTIQNITDNSTNAGTTDFGVLLTNSTGASVSPVVSNNIIKEISSRSGVVGTTLMNFGISVQNFTGTAIDISGNNISGMRIANTGAVNPYAVGIQVQGNTSGGTISRNKMFDFSNTVTGTTAGIYGIYTQQGNDWTVSNNMVSINNGANTNNISISGIVDQSTGGSYKGYYNSVYVGGNTTGAQNNYGFVRYTNAATSLKNNLFVIDRIGGTGFSYAIANDNATPADGWPAGASSYNTFITPTATNVGEWNNTAQSFAGWKTTSGGDLESYADLNAVVSVTNLYTDAINGGLTIKTANTESWYANGKAIAGSASGSLATDFAGNARGTIEGTPTDIGAHEFTPGAGVFPPDNVASGAPALSTTTSYTFGGRPIGSIIWGAAGTVPTAVTWKYYSGVPGVSGGINSYQDVPETGGSGYVFDIKQYFTTAEQNQIPDAALQGIKKEGAGPWTNIGGTLATDPAGKFITSVNQTSFSLFSLAPSGVVPVKLISFTGSRSNGINSLVWLTENEAGTKEFILERSTDGNRFTVITAKQARGFGNANYAYNDGVIFTGKMYYRLKIIDNNGRFVYSNIIVLSEEKNLITSLYPNPVLDKATLQIKDNSLLQTTAVLFDINGREIRRVIIRNAFELIDFSGITPGTYLLRLANKEVVKIIKN